MTHHSLSKPLYTYIEVALVLGMLEAQAARLPQVVVQPRGPIANHHHELLVLGRAARGGKPVIISSRGRQAVVVGPPARGLLPNEGGALPRGRQGEWQEQED